MRMSVMLAAAMLSVSPVWTQPAAGQVVGVVHVGSAVVGEGLTAAVAVEVRDIADLYGYDIALAFDPAAVEVVDADPAAEGVQAQLGGFLDLGFVLRNEADNAAGTVEVALTQLNPSAPKQGSGTLFVVTVRGRRAGAPP